VYDVTLDFAELYYPPANCVGNRIFGMDIAQTTTNPDIASLDVCASAGGGNKAYQRTITGVQATTGVLDIKSVYGSVDDPELTAIEIVPASGSPQPAPDPAQVGQWSAPATWPLVTVHAAVLPTGNVLVFDGFAAGPNSQRIWNPTTGAFTPVPYPVNTFCAGHLLLPDGRVLVAGGHSSADVGIADTSIFDPTSGQWTAAQKMSVTRWYPTVVELGNGKALAFAGDNIIQDRPGATPPFSDGVRPSDRAVDVAHHRDENEPPLPPPVHARRRPRPRCRSGHHELDPRPDDLAMVRARHEFLRRDERSHVPPGQDHEERDLGRPRLERNGPSALHREGLDGCARHDRSDALLA
jgi:hypothetical protein